MSDYSASHSTSNETINRLGDEANRAAREFESRDQHPTIKREASKLAGDIKERVRGFAEERKAAGADRMTSLAGAADRAAENIETEAPKVAEYIRDAAEGLRGFSSTIRERSIDEIASDAQDFARRQPLVVFGGAVVAGLALSRFLKAGRGGGDGKL